MAETLKISEIVRTYREQLSAAVGKPIKQEEFGELLTAGLLNTGLTRQTIGKWESDGGYPDLDFLISLYTYHFATDAWQLRFCVECLKVMKPETFDSGVLLLRLPQGQG